MFTNIFYQQNFNIVGGTETFMYELAKISKKYNRDLTIVYRTGTAEQIRRIRKLCRIVQVDSLKKPIKCKKAFFNYATDIIDDVEAEEYIQVIHADFKDPFYTGWGIEKHPKITKMLAVSENNAKSFAEVTGYDGKIEVVYNPLMLDEEAPRIMTLISAQRFTKEKGEKRVRQLIQTLDAHNIPYIYHIFSYARPDFDSPNVIFHDSTLDIHKWLKHADYTVLLSDTEGFAYTAYESLCLGTPLIITDVPVNKELGCNENNSIVLNLDMSNLNVDEIYKKAGTFNFKYYPKYYPKPSKWLDLLEGESNYVEPDSVFITAICDYFDMELQKAIRTGTTYEVSEERAQVIIGNHCARYT